jgi:hypothetical protein
MGVWIMHKRRRRRRNFEGVIRPAGLLNSDFEQMTCSIFADHRQSYLVQLAQDVGHYALQLASLLS